MSMEGSIGCKKALWSLVSGASIQTEEGVRGKWRLYLNQKWSRVIEKPAEADSMVYNGMFIRIKMCIFMHINMPLYTKMACVSV